MSSELLIRIELLNKQINEIQFEHLKFKSDCYVSYLDLINKKKELTEKISKIKQFIETSGSVLVKEETVDDFNKMQQDLEKLSAENSQLEKEILSLKDQLAKLESKDKELSIKTEKLSKEIEKIRKNHIQKAMVTDKIKEFSARIKHEQDLINKLKQRLEKEKSIKENLLKFIESLDIIEDVIQSTSPLSNVEPPPEDLISKEDREKIIVAKRKIDVALRNYNPNHIEEFLELAQRAYENTVDVIININKEILKPKEDMTFEEKIFLLRDAGLPLNTRHLSAVNKMLEKVGKGVEIAPLASFSNELRDYYIDNLVKLNILDKRSLNTP